VPGTFRRKECQAAGKQSVLPRRRTASVAGWPGGEESEECKFARNVPPGSSEGRPSNVPRTLYRAFSCRHAPQLCLRKSYPQRLLSSYIHNVRSL